MARIVNRWQGLAVTIALAILIVVPVALASGPAPYNSATGGFPSGTSQCGSVAGTDLSGPIDLSQVEVVRARGISCSAARRVVKRCIAAQTVMGWKARLSFTSTLSSGRKRIEVRLVSGPVPACLQPRLLGKARTRGEFGPFEYPQSYPSKLPPPFKYVYRWTSPVNTYSAFIGPLSVSNVTLTAFGNNGDGKMRSFWFQYGKTRDLGSETEKQNPATPGTDDPIKFTADLLHLKAKTRYYWRAAANFDGPDGKIDTLYGTLGSFVTNAYPKLSNPSRPCDSIPPGLSGGTPLELTESLAVVCNVPTPLHFSKGACFPACSNFYHGTITCPKEFARNLNAGSWSLPVPKVGITLSINNLVSYWRSNDSNKFITWLPGKNANSPGGAVGPIPGWSDWDVAQWAYPDGGTSTDAQFWIYCTENFGDVINADALAAGEGTDTPSMTPPSEPLNLKIKKNADGGIEATWDPPATASPSGLAGYFLTVTGWKIGTPKEFGANVLTPVTNTGTSGFVPAAHVAILKKSAPPSGYDLVVAVAAVSREGSISTPATVPLP